MRVPIDRLRDVIDRHRAIVAVVCLAVAVRVVVAVSYRPALFFTDSWGYVRAAYGPSHLGGLRPPGYPLILWVLDGTVGRALVVTTTLQHLAGLVVGVLVYVLLIRLGVARWPAALAAAVVLLDSYAITLEQTILAEAFCTAALVGSVALLVLSRRAPLLVISGLLLAGAVIIRTNAVFAVPVWLVYALYRHRSPRARIATVVSLVGALVAFTAVNGAKTGHFGLTSADGWFLYGRTAAIADCSRFTPPPGTQRLCEPPGHPEHSPIYYVWTPQSPAWHVYGGMGAPGSAAPLRAFATAAIRARPFAYAGLVGADLLRYVEPGASTPGGSDSAITLPAAPGAVFDPATRDQYFPDYRPAASAPAGLARAYADVFHFPRPLLVVLVAAPLVLLALRRGAHLAEVLLLSGSGIALVVGATATSAFVIRYLVPALPLLIAGAALAVSDLVAQRPRES
jgi:hypothetical protein